jgi:hypothetical protein
VPRLNAADVAVTKLKASTLKLVEDAETGKKTLEEVKEALAPPPADEEVEHIESLADETLPVLLNQLLDEINLFFEDPLVLTDPAKPPMPKTMSEVVDAINKVLPMLNRKKAA